MLERHGSNWCQNRYWLALDLQHLHVIIKVALENTCIKNGSVYNGKIDERTFAGEIYACETQWIEKWHQLFMFILINKFKLFA